MANKKITELDLIDWSVPGGLVDSDARFLVVDDPAGTPTTKQIRLGDLADAIVKSARYVTCPYCGQRNEFTREVCGYCGGRLE